MLFSYLQTAAREASRRPFRSVPAGYAHIHAHKQELSTHKRAHKKRETSGDIEDEGAEGTQTQKKQEKKKRDQPTMFSVRHYGEKKMSEGVNSYPR